MTGSNYTNTFGGENVSPANLSYVAYTVSAPITLTWAFEAVEGANVTADKIDINANAGGVTVKMPPANQVTVGQDCLFGSVGAQPYTVLDNGGNTICVVTTGTEWFIWLTDNTTAHGVWRSVQFGASTSIANAAGLAGAGLRARVTQLDQNLLTTSLTASYTITDGDRATVIQNTGGGVTYTFPDAGLVGNGWFVYVINAGTGNIALTMVGGDTIDGAAVKQIAPGETLAVLSDNANYHSLGYGRVLVSTVTGIGIPIGGPAGTVVLSATQAAAQIQDYSGVLTGNRRVEYGAGIGYWFVYNNTTPLTPFNVRMATGGADTGVIVPQGAFSIIRSNGVNMGVAFSGAVGTVTSVATTANMIGGPITSIGTLDLSNTGVTAGTYGDATHTGTFQTDIKGRITTASSTSIAIPITQITNLNTIIPPGMMMPWGALITVPIPPLWLPCDGTTRLISAFPALAAAIGNAFGPVTSTTFTLPDARGRVLAHQDAGTGRLRNGYFYYGDTNTIGNSGGTDANAANINIPQLFLRIGYWASPNQSSVAAGSVSITISGATGGPSSSTGVQFGGNSAGSDYHTHDWGGTGTSGIGWDQASFGAYGLSDRADNTAPPGLNGTTYFGVAQPTLIVRYLIKT